MTEQVNRELKSGIEYHGMKFSRALEDFDKQRQELADNVRNGKEDPLQLVIHDKQLERHLVDHDSTGAKQGVLLGKDLAVSLNERGMKMDESGNLLPHPDDSGNYLGMVTIVELDRFNAEGGHKAGNKGLSTTVKIIENAIHSVMRNHPAAEGIRGQPLEDYYDIYHTRGADFVYTLHLNDLPVEYQERVAEQIRRIIDTSRPTPQGDIEVIDNTDEEAEKKSLGSPLSTALVRSESMVDMFNAIQERLKESGQAPLSGNDARRTFIGMQLHVGEQVAAEHGLLIAKGDRVLSLLKQGDTEKAADYFQKYLQKFLDGTTLADFSAFSLPEGDDQTRRDKITELSNELYKVFENKIKDTISRNKAMADVAEQAMLDVVWNEDLSLTEDPLSKEDQEYLDSLPMQPLAEVLQTKADTDASAFLADYNQLIDKGFIIADKLWRDTNSITEEEMDALMEVMGYGDIPDTVDAAGENVSVSAPLLKSFLAIKHGKGTHEDFSRVDLLMKTALVDLNLSTAKIDTLTGLPNRAEYYIRMRDRLRSAHLLPSEKKVGAFVIDLGFVKYLNGGGREVGGLAIQTTGEMLEEAIAKAGVDGEAFRYGGDEFTCLYTGTKEDERRLIRAIEDAKEKKGVIKRTEKSARGYRPEKLVINYGTADNSVAENTMQALAAKGLLPEAVMQEINSGEYGDAYYDYLANVQTRIADLSIDAQKAYSRYIYLLERVTQDFPREFPQELSLKQRQTALLVKSSQKAIFGMSVEDLHRYAYNPAYDIGTIEGNDNLLALIEKKRAEEHKVIDDTRKLEDAVVVTFVHENALNKRLADAEQRLFLLEKEHAIERARNQALLAELAKLEAQLEERNETRVKELKQELERHTHREMNILQHKSEITQIQEQKQVLSEMRHGLQVETQNK